MKIKPVHTLSLILILLGIVYISENTNLWMSNYILFDDKSEFQDLKQYNTQLNTQVAQYNAIGNVVNNNAVSGMEKAEFVYLDEDGSLVKK